MLPVCLALCLDLPQISSAFLCLLSIWVYRCRTGSICHHLLPTPCCSSYFSSQASDLSLIWIFWPHTKTCRSSFPHIYTMFLSQAEGTPHAWWLRGLGLVVCDPPVGPTGGVGRFGPCHRSIATSASVEAGPNSPASSCHCSPEQLVQLCTSGAQGPILAAAQLGMWL